MTSKPISWKTILEKRSKNEMVTKTQSAKTAYNFILNKYKKVKFSDMFYHKSKGVWRQKL